MEALNDECIWRKIRNKISKHAKTLKGKHRFDLISSMD